MNDMSETIKDIIFEENSTLFQILDQLQVTDIVDLKTKTSSLERDQRDIKVQLDALAIKQNNFEGTTNAWLIALNTEVENINTDTSELSTKVSTLQTTVESVNSSLQEETTRIDSLYARVNAQTTQISDLSDKVTNNDNSVTEMKEQLVEIQQTVIYLGNVVSGFSDELSQLRTDLTSLQVTTVNLDNKIVNITKQITTGTRIMRNTDLFVWQYQYGRMSRFTYIGNDDYMLVGKQYNSVSMTGWLSGVYNITIGIFDPSINNTYEMPSGYTVPVTSGTVYRFYYGSGSLNFSALIYT